VAFTGRVQNFCIDTVNNLKAIVGIDCALVLADLLMISSMVYTSLRRH